MKLRHKLVDAITLATIVAVPTAFLLGGYKLLATPLIDTQLMLASITIWDILSVLSPVLAPIVSLVLVLVGRFVWNHEQRLRSLERGKTRHSRSLYGDEDDPTQAGISSDVQDLEARVSKIEEQSNEILHHVRNMNGIDDDFERLDDD